MASSTAVALVCLRSACPVPCHTVSHIDLYAGGTDTAPSSYPQPSQPQFQQRPAAAAPGAPAADNGYMSRPYSRPPQQQQQPQQYTGQQHQASQPAGQQQQPWTAYPAQGSNPRQQPHQPHAQQQTGLGSSNGSTMLQSLMQKPVKMLDTALRKISAAESSIRCAGCDKSVAFGPAVRALGQQWHPQCFRCAGCHQPLTGASCETTFAVGQDGQPYHSECHKQLFHPKCGVCHDYIPTRAGG